jgi:DNA-nicking Smr family endonuclease
MRRVPIEDSFDLHSFLPADVGSAVEDYLREAAEAGFVEVRLIHGKGTGVRRAQVRRLLASHPAVDEFADAPPDRGGMGATVVRLRASSPSPPRRGRGPG